MTATTTISMAVSSEEATAVPKTPEPVKGRRARRICIDAHTEFVATLVAELQSSVARLQSASSHLATRGESPESDSEVDVAGLTRLDTEAKAIARLVGLLDAVDGPTDRRHLEPLSLPSIVADAADGLDVKVRIEGEAGDGLFVADAACLRTGVELLLLALAGDGNDGPVEVCIAGDHVVVLDGTMDMADDLRSWQLRCGRRVIEGEGCRVSLMRTGGRYRIEVRAGR